MKGGKTVLETRGLSMHFGGVKAVDRVDFNLREGELRCLIGPNGAGKSTFFKCLTGQLRPTGGDVIIRGRSVAGRHPHEIAALGVGIKTQTPNLFDGLSAGENLRLAARRRHGDREARTLADEALQRLRLTAVRDRPAGQLAHGQRQWIELAMTIVAEPWLVLLDEPTAGMTAGETARTAALIRDINRAATLVVVAHDMAFIHMISQTVTLFHEGRVLMEGSMEDISADARARNVYLGRRR